MPMHGQWVLGASRLAEVGFDQLPYVGLDCIGELLERAVIASMCSPSIKPSCNAARTVGIAAGVVWPVGVSVSATAWARLTRRVARVGATRVAAITNERVLG